MVLALALIVLAAVIVFACFRASGIARLANALHWMFSGVAVLLLLCALVALLLIPVAIVYEGADRPDLIGIAFIPIVIVLGVPALLAWLVGRLCHYVLGGDASALWERAFIARARRSSGFRKVCIGILVLAVVSVAWSILDARHREALREQEHEKIATRRIKLVEEPSDLTEADVEKWLAGRPQEAARQEEARQDAERQREAKERQRQSEERRRQEEARHAAIAAQQAAIQAEADRKAAALRDTMIDPSSLSMTVMIGTAWGGEGLGQWVPVSRDLSGTVVNHSNKTLRAIEVKVQVRDCPQCLVTEEWDRKYGVDVPPGQQRNFGGQAWRIKKDGRLYTWQLLTASSCSWVQEKLVCP
jgi:hypothetical protein